MKVSQMIHSYFNPKIKLIASLKLLGYSFNWACFLGVRENGAHGET